MARDAFDYATDALRDALETGERAFVLAAAMALVHTAGPTLDLPLEEIPGDPIRNDVPTQNLADHILVTAGIVEQYPGLGAVGFTFQRGSLTAPPVDVTTADLIGRPDVLRKAGKLLRDTCNMAANRAEAAAHQAGHRG